MKKIIYLMMAAAMLFASCSQDENIAIPNDKPVNVTFRLTTDKVKTRAAVTDLTRYAVEVYQNGTKVEEVKDNMDGNLSLPLVKGDYTCLFWADYGEANYDITDLQNVTLLSGATKQMAYCLKADIKVTDGTEIPFVLKHAVAAIQLIETQGFKENYSLKVSFSKYYTGYNVMTGAVMGTSTTHTETLNVSAFTGEKTIASFYTFAPANEANISEFKFKLGAEAEKPVPNVPLQTNYQTIIKGSFSSIKPYTFSVTAATEWDGENKWDSDGNIYPLALGAKYMKDGVEVGKVILTEANKALVMLGYDFVTGRDRQSAEAYVTEKGGRLPEQDEFPTLYDNLRNSANTDLFGGSIVADFAAYDYYLWGIGGAYHFRNGGSWNANVSDLTDAKVLAVKEINW